MKTDTKTTCKEQQSQHNSQVHWRANRTINISHTENLQKSPFKHDPWVSDGIIENRKCTCTDPNSSVNVSSSSQVLKQIFCLSTHLNQVFPIWNCRTPVNLYICSIATGSFDWDHSLCKVSAHPMFDRQICNYFDELQYVTVVSKPMVYNFIWQRHTMQCNKLLCLDILALPSWTITAFVN